MYICCIGLQKNVIYFEMNYKLSGLYGNNTFSVLRKC
jgi:hypothetical protein